MVSALVLKFVLCFTEPLKATFRLLLQHHWCFRLKFSLYFVHWLELSWYRSLLPAWPSEQCGTFIFSSSLGETVDHIALQLSQEGDSLLLIF